MTWSFLTSHAAVILVLAKTPDATLRVIARTTGLTERRVQTIVDSLRAEGYLTVHRDGRRNRYEVDLDKPLRREPWSTRTIGDLVRALESGAVNVSLERNVAAMQAAWPQLLG